MTEKTLGLYVHIPFCERKCAYCDFLSAPASEETKVRYVNILCEEIEREAVRYPGDCGATAFFGGGTPTTLKPEQLEKILCKLKKRFFLNPSCAEVTLECNPGTVTKEDLRKLRAAGFNRLSLGLQSAKDEELRMLDRIHTWAEFLETYHAARTEGFENINVDLMSALPGQSVQSYVNSLERVIELRPDHVSAYSLTIEEGTPFFERYGEADLQRKRDGADRARLLPTEEEERQMYALTGEILGRRGYRRYEISNYALPGFECRHNITYWRRGDYLGFGPGAASLIGNKRFSRSRDLGEYEAQARGGMRCQEAQVLSAQEQMEEFMFLGLRMTDGVSAAAFRDCFQIPIEEVYGEALCKLERHGLLVRERGRVYLTDLGIDVSNVVLAEFLL